MKLPVPAPQLRDLRQTASRDLDKILNARVGPEIDGVYEHWDQLRHLTPPAGLTSLDWWAAIKFARAAIARDLPLHDKSGDAFKVSVTGTLQRKLHFLDREAAGVILGAEEGEDEAIRKRHLMRALIEEAMTSSQLEGASTTRQVAKEMLVTGRPPRDRGEQMIFNNYVTMHSLRQLRDQPLTVERLLEVHRLLMHDALDDPGQAGRLRTAEDNVIIEDRSQPDRVLHVPPPAAELPQRLQALCDFANGGAEGEFLHPIVRAIAIHFQIGYDHPFCDGNGRTARTLFYWSMLRSGYWLSEYISISSVLKKAPSPYVQAYLNSESDGADETYFVAHQLDVIIKAVNSLRAYLARKRKERRQAEALLRPVSRLGAALNHRQRALLLNALRRPDRQYLIAGHQGAHGITYATARADLLGLVEAGLLLKHKIGKAFIFNSVPDLPQRLDQDGAAD